MKILKLLRATAAVSLLALPLEALCQQLATVGEILDKGGQKLTREEVIKLVPGATISGISMTNYPSYKSEYTYKGDGSMSGGALKISGGGFTSASGKWSVNEDGQLCTDRSTSSGRSDVYCDHYFSLAEKYYASRTADKAALAVEREIKR
jgi:hypothetical protein